MFSRCCFVQSPADTVSRRKLIKNALFGFTGFVGSNLLSQFQFDDLFNSSNSPQSSGTNYDIVVFAAAKAEKWRINQDPDGDLQHIEELESLVAHVHARRFVLISTVDVYGVPIGVDEGSAVDTEGLHAYGKNRYHLERFVREHHPEALIVRLPGLFGPGLKKNVIYDLLHNNNVDRIHADGSFQYYNLEHLWSDVTTALEHELKQVNLTSAPIRTGDLAREAFGLEFDNRPEGVVAGRYDMQTQFSEVFGNHGPYTRTRDQTLQELADFVRTERAIS